MGAPELYIASFWVMVGTLVVLTILRMFGLVGAVAYLGCFGLAFLAEACTAAVTTHLVGPQVVFALCALVYFALMADEERCQERMAQTDT